MRRSIWNVDGVVVITVIAATIPEQLAIQRTSFDVFYILLDISVIMIIIRMKWINERMNEWMDGWMDVIPGSEMPTLS